MFPPQGFFFARYTYPDCPVHPRLAWNKIKQCRCHNFKGTVSWKLWIFFFIKINMLKYFAHLWSIPVSYQHFTYVQYPPMNRYSRFFFFIIHPVLKTVVLTHPVLQTFSLTHSVLQLSLTHPVLKRLLITNPVIQKFSLTHPVLQTLSLTHPVLQTTSLTHPVLLSLTHPELLLHSR